MSPEVGAFNDMSPTGRFKRTGSVVHFVASVAIPGAGTATGVLYVNLPVLANPTVPGIGVGKESGVTGAPLTAHVVDATRVAVMLYDNSSAIASGAIVQFSITYEAA